MPSISSVALSALACLLALPTADAVPTGTTYKLTQNNVGTSFLQNFDWETTPNSPTGRVAYTTQQASLASNLTYANANTFIMRVDHTTTLNSSSTVGRQSVRIKSNAQYGTHMAVFDIRHMPQGCGTWPAIWEADDSVGIVNGELDILEGVNSLSPSYTTLHTPGSCTLSATRSQTGTAVYNNCSSSAAQASGNNGCSVSSTTSNSFGPTFNSNGGGWYVVERNPTSISVWFWARNDKTVPATVSSGASSISTTGWKTPLAYFPSSSTCNLSANLKNHNIIINTMLCGSWAGSRYAASGCPSDCISYVNANPSAFVNAYWEFAALRIYT
ncbi:glycoside hydrolase family 16 protein [Gelatoporia subvermispora B]|uniref:Glycoside hydrolase family 16 protein n=1 Tax=Ceriporiopsis subvermispora (strain B) TaxID=914234 RepID=M2QC53_CERS8|nr:glycoside hydrolase family 16 protein [Gelatoporia subvermispora B]